VIYFKLMFIGSLYYVTCNFIMIPPEWLPKFLVSSIVYPGVPTEYLNCANLLSEVALTLGTGLGVMALQRVSSFFGGGLNKWIIG